MNILKKTLRQNPQKVPKTKKLCLYFTLAVIAEIILLLVVPLTYFASLPPNPVIYADGTYPLTDAQIRESWPNLPTAQQIVDGGAYGFFDTNGLTVMPNSTANKIYYQSSPRWWDNVSSTYVIENRTETNLPGSLGLIPIAYYINLELHNSTISNSTVWVYVPFDLLDNTVHPPEIPKLVDSGFLGTSMPTTYGLTAITIISITVTVCVCYLMFIRHRMKHLLNSDP